VSDFIEGESLYRYIRFGKHSTEELHHIAAQVAQIWEQLAEFGITHNDFKPENFIVDDQRNVWIIDLEKMRVGGDASRQRQKHIFDATNFLHVRGWHLRSEARAVFAEALLKTKCGDWLKDTGVARVANGLGLHEHEKDTDLSVVIVCDDGLKPKLARQAIESVRDIADEVVLVQPADGDHIDVLKRIDFFGGNSAISINSRSKMRTQAIARCNWVLALEQNESVTPFLAKELQQRIADSKRDVAFRIPIEQLYFGHTMARLADDLPIRLFRNSDCSLDVTHQSINVSPYENQPATQLVGTIQSVESSTVAEFIDCLNSESSRAALKRHFENERPQLVWSGLWAARQFFTKCIRGGGIRNGWAGLHLAALESAFIWIEEMKLHQLTSEFRRAETEEAAALLETVRLFHHGESEVPSLAKAA
jgi:serine/threonine protein kinase